ncbi:MAG: hypothetical protein RBR71_03690 [Gudongella sp.]|nr:hypothetical protein [Gudongella sp.]
MENKNNNIFTEEAKEIIKKSEKLNRDIDNLIKEYEVAFKKCREISDWIVTRTMKESETYGDLQIAEKDILSKVYYSDMKKDEYTAATEFIKEAYKRQIGKHKIKESN